MAEEERKEDFEKIEFTPEGETLGYISLDQARLLAMQTARDAPGNYGRRFSGSRMVFDVVEQEDGEDYYIVTLSFRPEGDFAGTPGQEQFFIEKEGSVAHRQVLSLPSGAGGRRLPIVPIGIGLAVVIIIAIAGVALVSLSSSSEEPSAEVAAPTNTLAPPRAATQALTATPVRIAPTPTRARLVIVQPTSAPTQSPTQVVVRRLEAPTPTPTPVPLVRLRITPVPTAAPRLLLPSGQTPTPTPTPTPVRLQIAPNVSPRPVKFITEDGVTLSGQLFNGGGELAVIMSHAFATDQRSWTAFARLLAEDHNYVVLTFDFRGYGESGGDTIIPDLDRDVRAALKFARERGAAKVVLIGASMGGTASLRVAGTEKVEGVVALSPLEGFHGLTMGDRRIRWPVLLMAEAGDLSAARSSREMLDSGLLGDGRNLTSILYLQGDSHGRGIFLGPNGPDARKRILEFLAIDAGG